MFKNWGLVFQWSLFIILLMCIICFVKTLSKQKENVQTIRKNQPIVREGTPLAPAQKWNRVHDRAIEREKTRIKVTTEDEKHELL
jgi:hypothetical protein